MRTYIDILIWHLRGENKAKDFLVSLRDKERYEWLPT